MEARHIKLSSTHLRNNHIAAQKKNGVDQDTINWEIDNTQAHHIIPIQVADNLYEARCISADEYNQFDNPWNCMLLPNNYVDSANAVVHLGSHPNYTQWIKSLIFEQNKQKNCFTNCMIVADLVRQQISEVFGAHYSSFNVNNMNEFLKYILECYKKDS